MLPAMATTLVAFLFARIAVAVLVRPNIQGEETRTALVAGGEHIVPNPARGQLDHGDRHAQRPTGA